jgi:hypothetical protein
MAVKPDKIECLICGALARDIGMTKHKNNILCFKCFKVINMADNNPERLIQIAEYLVQLGESK